MRKFRVSVVLMLMALVMASVSAVSAQDSGNVLDDVLARGYLNCGVSGGIPGFSFQDETGEWSGLDVDFCRVLAVALFGESNDDTLHIVPLTADVRFTALQAGEVDVLHRNTTWTLTRDVTLGSDFGPTTFYDGQGLLVRLEDGFATMADMEGASFCSTSGTTTEKNLTDAYRAIFGEDPILILAAGAQDNLADFENGTCDVLTSDKSQLAGLRSSASNPAAYTIIADTLSKEPLGPMYLEDNSGFGDIVNWSVYAVLTAEELGITSENIGDFADSDDANIRRFLGLTEDGFGTSLGISNSFAADIIAQVGNYAEIYDRNVTPLGMAREGSLNAAWTNGGLHYPPAWR